GESGPLFGRSGIEGGAIDAREGCRGDCVGSCRQDRMWPHSYRYYSNKKTGGGLDLMAASRDAIGSRSRPGTKLPGRRPPPLSLLGGPWRPRDETAGRHETEAVVCARGGDD